MGSILISGDPSSTETSGAGGEQGGGKLTSRLFEAIHSRCTMKNGCAFHLMKKISLGLYGKFHQGNAEPLNYFSPKADGNM